MFSKPRIYLETTLFSYYHLKDSFRKEEIFTTRELFAKIKNGLFEPYTSNIVIAELSRCSDLALQKKMLKLMEEFNIIRLAEEDYRGYETLGEKYILAGAIPKQKRDDALHIACATLSGMDILVSWNCEHIVRFKTQQIVRAINLVEGVNDIAINTPKEVINLE